MYLVELVQDWLMYTGLPMYPMMCLNFRYMHL